MFIGGALALLAPFNVARGFFGVWGPVRRVSRVPVRAPLERRLRLARCVPQAAPRAVHGSGYRVRRRRAGVLESEETHRGPRAAHGPPLVAGNVQPGAEHWVGRASGPRPQTRPPSVASFANGPHAAVTRRAVDDCNEIVRLVESLPKADRDRIPDVIATARTLANKVLGLAASLSSSSTVPRETSPRTRSKRRSRCSSRRRTRSTARERGARPAAGGAQAPAPERRRTRRAAAAR